MYWVDRLDESLSKSVSPKVKKAIMAKAEVARSDENSLEKTRWICGAMCRLDKVADAGSRAEIMAGCSDQFPRRRIAAMKKTLARLGDIDDLLKVMHKDGSWFGLSFYEYPVRKGNVIYVEKIPFDPKGYKKAKSAIDRRYHYCHCRLVKELIKHPNERISPTFCYCGAGWYKALWEGILGKEVRVELLESVLQGNDSCKFAIHIPRGSVQRSGHAKNRNAPKTVSRARKHT